ncbi:hypothetical protein SEVIR_1G009050v4 [Setaria viridis]
MSLFFFFAGTEIVKLVSAVPTLKGHQDLSMYKPGYGYTREMCDN